MDRNQHAALHRVLAAATGRVGLLLIHLKRRRPLQGSLGLDGAEALQALLLQRIAELLRPGDEVLANGADGDIAVLLPGLLSPGHAQMAAQRILREFEQPVDLGGRIVLVGLVIGLATCPDHADDAAGLARAALLALDQAVQAGQRMAMALPHTDEGPRIEELRQALLQNELTMVFQPQLDLRSGRMVAVEALARWQHPQLGDVPPERFIALAERVGLASELTRWSLNAALRLHAQLRQRHPGLGCAFNLSPKSFGQTGLVEQILAALELWDLPPRQLTLEVTETVVLEDPDYSGWILGQLDAAGIEIALDDFGRGYSSFTYLRHFPVSELKVDQTFVAGLPDNARDRQIVRSIVELAHNLGLRAVAEGVESPQALELLAQMGCDRAQGYHVGRPQPLESLQEAPLFISRQGSVMRGEMGV